ncbi:hypothetical protein DFH07DRAFT_1027745 [Mycena maculata]|uniref:RING-type E3 ubiquitin transferase n=1 Tax=Mycena maculata TaxID=230809 RepID=A0AAD7J3Q1_9AGAR|nr:hypothetical protein DFH07DRAFT_1027745 [Mycena maculata]
MSTVVTKPQPRTQRGSNKRGNNRRGASRGAGTQSRAAEKNNDEREVSATDATTTVEDTGDDAEDGAICWICAEPVKYYAVSECNHRTCHVCALRLRALYKKIDCTFCKDPQPTMVFTTAADALFGSFETSTMGWKDAKLGIYFETQEMMEETLLLLRFNCPDAECDFIGNSWSDIKLHVRASHGRLMCDLCIRHKKVFAHEHALYPPNLLPLHLPSMLPSSRSNRSAKDKDKEQQIEGGTHPLCEFCRECFFGDDELFAHMREAHEECFVCKRAGVRDQYFQNYAALEAHFTHAHHPCPHATCLGRKFVVFGSALDLQAHVVEEHAGEMGKGGRRDARRVEAGGRGRERERDRDRDRDREGEREAPPHQQAQAQPQPQRPPGVGGRRREGFGAALTVEGESPPPPATTPPPPQVARTDVDPVTAERHAAFLSRLAALAPNPTTALPAARAAIRSFRAAESPARDLISTLWSVVDARMEPAASIVNAFVDLLEEGEQREAVLAAWRGFEIEQRRQFPALNAVPDAVGSGYAGITSGRVLNAKHATAGRGAQVWDRVAQAASSSSSAPASATQRFPALGPAGASSSAAAGPRPGQRNTPWSANGAAPAATGYAPSSAFVPPSSNGPPRAQPVPFSTNMPSAPTSGKGGGPPKLSNALFPELPPSAGARTRAPVSGNVSLRNILAGGGGPPAASAWGAGGGANTRTGGGSPREEEGADAGAGGAGGGGGGGKKKGKGKGKQTLFTLGTFPS